MNSNLPRLRRPATFALAALLLVGVGAGGTWQVRREARRATQGEALLRAAGRGDTRAVQTLLATGADPNWRPSTFTVLRRAVPPAARNNPRYWPALARAWRAGTFDASPYAAAFTAPGATGIIPSLGMDRAGVHTWDQYVRNPLILAASRGDASTVQALLRAGANVEAQDGDGRTALLAAVDRLQTPSGPEAGYGAAIRLLLDHGANVHATTRTVRIGVSGIGETPLLVAAGGGCHWKRIGQGVHAQVMRALLDHGADPNAASTSGVTPLMRAVDCKNLPAAQTLLRAGARVNARDAAGRTALGLAASAGRLDLIALLKQAGARR